ncbi:MAG: rhamnulokinase, partial [Phycisphaerae bacterium]|nr:rhamnulokinase [Phycisphaerae bacterium]
MSSWAHIAIDLGAESGRVMVGVINRDRLTLREAHRFAHLPVPTPAGLCWDVTGLWRSILEGLRAAGKLASAEGIDLLSVGVDTWGVDFALLSPGGQLLGLPLCYREPSFQQAFERCVARLTHRQIYDSTGIQLMPINSLYQYEHRNRTDPAAVAAAKSLLFMPDLFHWLLSGKAVVERTIASTSQMVDARTGEWNRQLLQFLQLPCEPLGAIVDAGTVIGTILPEVARSVGLPETLKVVAPPAHDTAAAVVAVPTSGGDDWAYLSSGTWSLLGAELSAPIINDASADANFTNELGFARTVRFLKNIAGLWLVQECRRQWERQGNPMDYTHLTAAAEQAPPLRTLIPVNDPAFAAPGEMADRIAIYARQTRQPVPQSPGEFIRCCLESLALEYRRALQTLQRLINRQIAKLHIIGGGARNGLLNQMTADATGATVLAGPFEATACGNILGQAIGLGRLSDLAEARRI